MKSTPPERKTARGTSLARWSLSPSSRIAARPSSSMVGSGARSGMRQKSSWRTSLPAPSNSSSRPGQRRSTPLTAVPGPTTNPFHTLLATACGLRRGVPSSPEASRARSSEAKATDQPASGSDDRAR